MRVVDDDRTIVVAVANKTAEHEGHPDHRALAGGLARAGVFGFSDGLVSNVSLIIGFAAGGVDSSVLPLLLQVPQVWLLVNGFRSVHKTN